MLHQLSKGLLTQSALAFIWPSGLHFHGTKFVFTKLLSQPFVLKYNQQSLDHSPIKGEWLELFSPKIQEHCYEKRYGCQRRQNYTFFLIFSLCFFYNSFFSVHQLLTTKASPQAQSQFLRLPRLRSLKVRKSWRNTRHKLKQAFHNRLDTGWGSKNRSQRYWWLGSPRFSRGFHWGIKSSICSFLLPEVINNPALGRAPLLRAESPHRNTLLLIIATWKSMLHRVHRGSLAWGLNKQGLVPLLKACIL